MIAKADTDPLCPGLAILHLSYYQKYIEPFVIPLNIQVFFYFFHSAWIGKRQSAHELEN